MFLIILNPFALPKTHRIPLFFKWFEKMVIFASRPLNQLHALPPSKKMGVADGALRSFFGIGWTSPSFYWASSTYGWGSLSHEKKNCSSLPAFGTVVGTLGWWKITCFFGLFFLGPVDFCCKKILLCIYNVCIYIYIYTYYIYIYYMEDLNRIGRSTTQLKSNLEMILLSNVRESLKHLVEVGVCMWPY